MTNVDPTVAFFELAGSLYDPLAEVAAGLLLPVVEGGADESDSDSEWSFAVSILTWSECAGSPFKRAVC